MRNKVWPGGLVVVLAAMFGAVLTADQQSSSGDGDLVADQLDILTERLHGQESPSVQLTLDKTNVFVGEQFTAKIKIRGATPKGIVWKLNFSDGSKELRGEFDDKRSVTRSHRYSAAGVYQVEARVQGLGKPHQYRQTIHVSKQESPGNTPAGQGSTEASSADDDCQEDRRQLKHYYIGLLALVSLVAVQCMAFAWFIHAVTTKIRRFTCQ
nr:uncharacterized protein LOC123746757 [Procambarus clarkii]